MNHIFRLMLLCGAVLMVARTAAADSDRPNVLFIAVDDLRPQLRCYGEPQMVSPNIDRLAASGVLFERAYCMVPTCGASRASLMTGLRPSPRRFVNYLTRAEKDAPGITTMNTHFRTNGYETASIGKVFHHSDDSASGWSTPAWRPRTSISYHVPENQTLHRQRRQEKRRRGRGPAFEAADAPDSVYPDGRVAAQAIAELKRLSEEESPFFLAVGFFKPHLPFVCPQKYWDLYDRDAIRLPETYHRPQGAPDVALHTSGELRAYAGIPAKGPVSDETAINLIHGYYACVSFTDAQVGKLLDTLDELGLAEDTIVVLWGDHGWNLGEHELWCKHSCFETSMRIPLIVRAPGIAGGGRTEALTETIDLYPTLCELAGLPLPEHLQGESLVARLKNPAGNWEDTAVGRYKTGDTIRNDRYRFSEYLDRNGKRQGRMLYDHETDPGEDTNIVRQTDAAETVESLTEQLHSIKGRD
ncbi:Arylsulfatase [Maioricimonas rarisocia]|uniref:Arylsulfatase n=1 Tax=Maioricimonas rarisocia TaxID=2528026 RepID=A0A517Z6C6_9PLAN|nr:sulfatase [Maioricimonas rarisocia]QDU38036.1 Arylsulfatase [Maioricimonas rarisocia]